MKVPPLPANESSRLDALHGLGILYTPAEERFDRITRLAAQTLNVPIALVSLVDEQCQWFKSARGLEATETSREVSFCGHAILEDETLVIPDTANDPRFADNPLVTGPPFIRFYAGHPVKTEDGSKIGTLCIIDSKPRYPTAAELETLRDLAAWVESELRVSAMSHTQIELISELDHLRRKSMIDGLTRIWNREAIEQVLERELARSARQALYLSVMMADVDHFKRINDTYGHPVGDKVLVDIAKNMRAAVRPYDAIGRYGGEEFLIVLGNCDEPTALTIAKRMRQRVAISEVETEEGPLSATLSLGLVSSRPADDTDGKALIEAADDALYAAKENGRDRVEIGSL